MAVRVYLTRYGISLSVLKLEVSSPRWGKIGGCSCQQAFQSLEPTSPPTSAINPAKRFSSILFRIQWDISEKIVE